MPLDLSLFVVMSSSGLATVYGLLHILRKYFARTKQPNDLTERSALGGEPPDGSPRTQDEILIIRELVRGIVAAVIVIGCFVLLIWAPAAPRDIITLILGTVVGYYFATSKAGAA